MDTPWIEPPNDLRDLSEIWRYAYNFDGYSFAHRELGIDCGKLANERLSEYRDTGRWRGSFEELRCCLFFEQRRARHLYQGGGMLTKTADGQEKYVEFARGPSAEELRGLHALCGAIREAWARERG